MFLLDFTESLTIQLLNFNMRQTNLFRRLDSVASLQCELLREMLGLTKYRTQPESGYFLRGSIKEVADDFRVTEVLDKSILEAPPTKKARQRVKFDVFVQNQNLILLEFLC